MTGGSWCMSGRMANATTHSPSQSRSCGQRRPHSSGRLLVSRNLFGRPVDIANLEQRERARDVVADGAGLLARRGRALDAAHRLSLRRFEVEAEEDLVPVLLADLRVLLVDRHAGDREAALNLGVLGHGGIPSLLRIRRVVGVDKSRRRPTRCKWRAVTRRFCVGASAERAAQEVDKIPDVVLGEGLANCGIALPG